MNESASRKATARSRSGRVTCRQNASGWWVYYPALRNGLPVRLRKRFGERQLANRFASEKEQEVEQHGICLGSLPPEVHAAYALYQELMAMLEAKGQALPAFDVLVAQALDAARVNFLPGASSVAECVERYLSARKPDLTAKAYLVIRLRLRDFARTHGTQSIQSITPQMIEDWLNGLTRKCKGPEYGHVAGYTKASPDSLNHYRSALVTFFGHAFECGWAPTNPAACVKRAIPDRPRAAVLTPNQAQALLRTAAQVDPTVLPALALQMFAGLRLIEVPDINVGNLLKKDCDIFQVASSKAGQREVPICENLREWLALTPPTSAYAWSGSVRELRRRLTHVFRAAECVVAIESPRSTYYRYQSELLNGAAKVYFSLTPSASGECPVGPTSPTSNHE